MKYKQSSLKDLRDWLLSSQHIKCEVCNDFIVTSFVTSVNLSKYQLDMIDNGCVEIKVDGKCKLFINTRDSNTKIFYNERLCLYRILVGDVRIDLLRLS